VEEKKEEDLAAQGAAGDFRYFHSFIASGEIFYVAKDHPDSKQAFPLGEEILKHAIKGNQKKLMMFDYSELMDRTKAQVDKDLEIEKEIMAFKQLTFDDERKITQRKYSYYHANRDFDGRYEN
jgi:hypothetical protein